jgi:glycosyltransferase involved in cell wall biosynthesis
MVLPEPTPFRTLLLDRVAERPELDLTVVYAARTIARRTWTIEPHHKAVFLDGISIPGAYRLLLHDYPLTRGVWRELSRAQPAVVVVSGWSTFAAQAAFAWCLTRRVPYLLFVESHDLLRRATWKRIIRHAVVPPFFRHAAGVLVVGALSRASGLAYGVDPDRVHLFANTVDVESWGEQADLLAAQRPDLRRRLGIEDDDVVVLSVARLVEEKRPDALVRAVAAAADPRLVLMVVGEGPERAALEALARSLDVRLLLPGDLPWDEVVETYVAADLFALLSARETWGVVVNEALACGLPLVLSDRVGAAADLLRDGENGVLVPDGDVAVAAQALRRLAGDRAARLHAGVKSRELARDWGFGPSIESFVGAVLGIARP